MNYLLLSPKKMDDEPLLKDGSGVVSMSLITLAVSKKLSNINSWSKPDIKI